MMNKVRTKAYPSGAPEKPALTRRWTALPISL